jgi:hypothetical protein
MPPMERPEKIIFAELRAQGVRCFRWPDEVRLSDLNSGSSARTPFARR